MDDAISASRKLLILSKTFDPRNGVSYLTLIESAYISALISFQEWDKKLSEDIKNISLSLFNFHVNIKISSFSFIFLLVPRIFDEDDHLRENSWSFRNPFWSLKCVCSSKAYISVLISFFKSEIKKIKWGKNALLISIEIFLLFYLHYLFSSSFLLFFFIFLISHIFRVFLWYVYGFVAFNFHDKQIKIKISSFSFFIFYLLLYSRIFDEDDINFAKTFDPFEILWKCADQFSRMR